MTKNINLNDRDYAESLARILEPLIRSGIGCRLEIFPARFDRDNAELGSNGSGRYTSSAENASCENDTESPNRNGDFTTVAISFNPYGNSAEQSRAVKPSEEEEAAARLERRRAASRRSSARYRAKQKLLQGVNATEGKVITVTGDNGCDESNECYCKTNVSPSDVYSNYCDITNQTSNNNCHVITNNAHDIKRDSYNGNYNGNRHAHSVIRDDLNPRSDKINDILRDKNDKNHDKHNEYSNPSCHISPSQTQDGGKERKKEKARTEEKEKVAQKEKEEKKPKEKNLRKERAIPPPTQEQVQEYCLEHGLYAVNTQRFFNHYESTGWHSGGTLLYDWTAKLREWDERDKAYSAGNQTSSPFGASPAAIYSSASPSGYGGSASRENGGITQSSFDGDEFLALAIKRSMEG